MGREGGLMGVRPQTIAGSHICLARGQRKQELERSYMNTYSTIGRCTVAG